MWMVICGLIFYAAVILCSYHVGRIRGFKACNMLWKKHSDDQFEFIKQFINDTDQKIAQSQHDNDERYYDYIEETSKYYKVGKGRN